MNEAARRPIDAAMQARGTRRELFTKFVPCLAAGFAVGLHTRNTLASSASQSDTQAIAPTHDTTNRDSDNCATLNILNQLNYGVSGAMVFGAGGAVIGGIASPDDAFPAVCLGFAGGVIGFSGGIVYAIHEAPVPCEESNNPQR